MSPVFALITYYMQIHMHKCTKHTQKNVQTHTQTHSTTYRNMHT